jgi:hypothetical protein
MVESRPKIVEFLDFVGIAFWICCQTTRAGVDSACFRDRQRRQSMIKPSMIKIATSLVMLLVAATAIAAQMPSATPTATPAVTAPAAPQAAPHTNLKVGQAAPDFTLASTIAGPDGRSVRYKLSDFKGKKNVVLAFYVLAFTGG